MAPKEPNKRPPRNKYTENDVLQAVDKIQAGDMTYRKAWRQYGIPIASLCDRLKHRAPLVRLGFKLYL